MTKLTHNGRPLDIVERAAMIMRESVEIYEDRADDRLTKDAKVDFLVFVEDYVNFQDDRAALRLVTLCKRLVEQEREEMGKKYPKKWEGFDSNDGNVVYWDIDSSLYIKMCIYVLREEIKFRLGLVSICESFILRRASEAVRAKSLGRRIKMANFHWPFTMQDLAPARIKKTRPVLSTVADFGKKLEKALEIDIFMGDVSDD